MLELVGVLVELALERRAGEVGGQLRVSFLALGVPDRHSLSELAVEEADQLATLDKVGLAAAGKPSPERAR